MTLSSVLNRAWTCPKRDKLEFVMKCGNVQQAKISQHQINFQDKIALPITLGWFCCLLI